MRLLESRQSCAAAKNGFRLFCEKTSRTPEPFLRLHSTQQAPRQVSTLRLHSTQQAPRQVSTATHPARSAHPSPLYTAQTVFGSSHTLRMPTLHPLLSRLPVAKPRLNIEAGVAPEARIAQLLAPLAISACMIPASASHGCRKCAFLWSRSLLSLPCSGPQMSTRSLPEAGSLRAVSARPWRAVSAHACKCFSRLDLP